MDGAAAEAIGRRLQYLPRGLTATNQQKHISPGSGGPTHPSDTPWICPRDMKWSGGKSFANPTSLSNCLVAQTPQRALLSRENYVQASAHGHARGFSESGSVPAATSAGLRAIWYLEAPYQPETAGSESVNNAA